MRSTTVLLTALLSLLIACKKSDKKPDETAAPAGSAAAAPAAAAPAAPAAPAAGKLTCDKVLSKALQDKYFAGATITDNPQPTDFTAECKIKFSDAAAPEGTIAVTCHDNMAAAMNETIKAIKGSSKDMKELSGVGKAALTQSVADIGHMVQAWDDDSNCNATVFVPNAIDAAAFTKDLLASLPPK
jgi:hypothetical protein